MLMDKMLGPMPAGCLPKDIQGALFAALIEYALNKIPAQTVVDTFELDTDEQTEAQNLVLAIRNGNTSLTGSTPIQRILEVQNVLLLGAYRVSPYIDNAAVKSRLGLP